VCVRFEKAIVPPAVQGYVVNADHEDTYWCAVLTYNPNHLDVAIGGATPVVYPRFEPDPAVPPRRLPGMMAAGEVSLGKTVANDGTGTYLVNPGGDDISADALYRDFTTFNIIFGPNGNVVRLVNGKYPEFGNRITCSSGTTVDMAASRVLFNQSGAANQGDLNLGILWADPSTTGLALEPGVTAMTIFDSKKLKDSPSRSSYLYDNAQILAINQYTGQLFARK